MHPLLKQLLQNGPVVTDGAWGTQLQAHGLALDACPDEWNLTQPNQVAAVARSYREVGSRILSTNTFGANRIALARHGLAAQAAEINRQGAAISRAAAGMGTPVFGTMGPTGTHVASDAAAQRESRAAFVEQAQALADGGADALLIETMIDLTEALLALAAARETGLPTVVCMLFGVGAAPDRTLMGSTPEQVAEALTDAGAEGIGTNCGAGAAQMLPACIRLRAASRLPLWIKPNAGLPRLVDGKALYAITPDEFAAQAVQLVRSGADFIGGCCGTGPDHIRALQHFLGR